MPYDWPEIIAILSSFSLPTSDLEPGTISSSLAAEKDGELVGCIACGIKGENVLFRSLAARADCQNHGIDSMLVKEMEALCRNRWIRGAFILTVGAVQLANKHGFQVVERNAVPPEIQQTDEFRMLCPCTAVCMTKEL